MRRANQAIIRESQPIPTIKEVLQALTGSTVFSQVDLKWGFRQILLSEKNRHVTTVVTHRSPYRYTRLVFGAPEKYQQIIRDVLRGCDGEVDIADDLIIHGKDLEQYDERVFAVHDRLKTAGLTLNKTKCKFKLLRLTFFGHEVTSNGTIAKQDRSPLCLVQFVSQICHQLQNLSRKTWDLSGTSDSKQHLRI